MAPGPAETAPPLTLRLYVAGDSPNSQRARCNLAAALGRLEGRYLLETVDVLTEPLRPLADGVLVTPTLVKAAPPPAWKMIGDLSETGRLLQALGIAEGQHD